MAEVTAMRNNATIFPVYGLPYSIVIPVLDADGDPVSGAAGLDSEISLNGDTPADCTNEATEIGTSGCYYLLLTASEMTADIISGVTKTSTSGAKTTPWVLYPRKLPILLTSDNAGAYYSATTINLGSSASAIDDFYNGCLVYIYGGTGSGQVRMITDYVGSTKLATVHVAWATNPDATSDLKIYRTELAPYVMAANVSSIAGTVQTARDIGASVLLSSGTGTGQVSLSSGLVKADLDTIKTQTVTCPGGVTIPAATLASTANITAGTITTVTNLTNAPTAGDLTATMKSSVTMAATASTPALSTAGVNAIVTAVWAALTSALTTSGSIGKKLADWVVGTIDTYTGNTKQTGDAFARLGAPAGATVSADVAAIKAETAAIVSDTNELQTEWANGGRLDLLLDGASAPSAADVADAVWNEAISGHLTAGSTGNALNAAGSAGDPWSTPLPGAYGAGTAGKIIGDNINAPIATIDTLVDGIATTLGLAGAGLTGVPWNASWDAEVQSECVDALTAQGYTTARAGYMDVLNGLVAAIWNAATSGMSAAGSIGKKLADWVVGTIDTYTGNTKQTGDAYARLGAPAGASISADVAAIKAETAAIVSDTNELQTEWANGGRLDLLLDGASAPTVHEIVDGVLDESLSAHAVVGSVGAGIAAAGSAGDPWSTALPGAYGAGTAGYIIGNNMPSPGSGSTSWPYRLTDVSTGQPIAGASIRVSTDAAGTVTVAAGTTDANGYVTFALDPGTYYIWRTKTGYTFTDPDTEVVS